jgi:hypothetical protein
MARPVGTKNKTDTFVWTSITLGLPKEVNEWYQSLSPKRGAKAKMIRDAIALYRIHNPE